MAAVVRQPAASAVSRRGFGSFCRENGFFGFDPGGSAVILWEAAACWVPGYIEWHVSCFVSMSENFFHVSAHFMARSAMVLLC